MASNNGKFAPEHRNPGDIILSDDWNAGMQEIVRLESTKVNREGAESLQGPLTIAEALTVSAIAPPTSTPLEIKGALQLAEGVAVNQFSADESLSTNSDSIVPTQKAVKTYIDSAKTTLDTADTALRNHIDSVKINLENADAALRNHIDSVKTNLENADADLRTYVDTSIVIKGMILMWSGRAERIPTGWALCNGQNGTPDLRDRFLVGAGQKYTVGSTGGAERVTLSEGEIPSHSHRYDRVPKGSMEWKSGNRDPFWDGQYNPQWEQAWSESAGGNQSHENMPPYYALCFIIKL